MVDTGILDYRSYLDIPNEQHPTKLQGASSVNSKSALGMLLIERESWKDISCVQVVPPLYYPP